MKKRTVCFILVLVLVMSLCMPAMAANVQKLWTDITYRGISIIINGVEIAPCDEKGNSTEPFIMNDTTYLPVRAIAGALGLNVGWEAATSTVVLESGGEANYGNGNPSATFNVKHVEITYRGTKISLDGENIPLINRNGESVEPFIYNGTNYLPLRVVSEALGLSVGWDGATSTVTLKGGAQPEEPKPEEPKPIEPTPPTEKTWRPSEVKYTGGITGNASSFYEMGKLTYEYDSFGRIIRVYTPNGDRKIICTYNSIGRIDTVETFIYGNKMNYAWKYNSSGEVVAFYENGWIKEGSYTEYDAAGRVVAEDFVSEFGASHNKYTYDDEGKLIVSELSGYMTERKFYIYDEQGCLVKTSSQDGVTEVGFEEFSYDEQGRVATKREKLRYDNDAILHRYSYDEQGRVILDTAFNDETGVQLSKIEYEYDSADRVIRQKVSSAIVYTNNQGESQFIEDFSNDEEFFSFDSSDRLIEYKKVTKGYYHDVEQDKYVPGTDHQEYIESYEYDAAGRLTKRSEKTLESVARDVYQLKEYICRYDDAGRLLEEKTVHTGTYISKTANQWTWTYDAAGRLLTEKLYELSGPYENWKKWSYSYNAKGDFIQTNYADSESNAVTEVYTYDYYGRVTTITTRENGVMTISSFRYDANGNNTRMEINSFGENVTIIGESSYVQVPKTEIDPLIVDYVAEIETLF